MRRTLLCVPLILLVGCASNAITGEGGDHVQVYHGDVGISGSEHRVTIQRGSDVRKLSIIGEDNEVTVEPGAKIAKVEIVGEDNKVYVPTGLNPEYSEIGEDNRLVQQGD